MIFFIFIKECYCKVLYNTQFWSRELEAILHILKIYTSCCQVVLKMDSYILKIHEGFSELAKV